MIGKPAQLTLVNIGLFLQYANLILRKTLRIYGVVSIINTDTQSILYNSNDYLSLYSVTTGLSIDLPSRSNRLEYAFFGDFSP